MSLPDDITFGNAAIELGICTAEQIRECLTLQAEHRRRGETPPPLLGRVLIERGYIKPHDIREILKRQKRLEVTCPACSHAFAATGRESPLACPLCQHLISPAVGAEASEGARPSPLPPVSPALSPIPARAAAGEAAGQSSSDGPGAPLGRLVFSRPGSETLDHEMPLTPGQSLTIGRSAQADLRVDDPALSRKHCRFFDQNGEVFLEDLGSRNGTLVNGAEIRTAVRLRSGDEILLGDSRVRFHAGGQTPRADGSDIASRFCAHCGQLISLGDLRTGVAQAIGEHTYCAECLTQQVFSGRQIDKYVAQEKVGQGGMAAVWKATEIDTGRVVALKVLLNAGKLTEHNRRRFLNEAEAGIRLKHPGLAAIYGSGESEGIPYIAMEFVEGRSVARRLDEEGRMPIDQAVRVALQIAQVLDYAHDKRVVHRDVKPANIVIDGRTGAARLLDLGVVKLADESLTRTGVGLGTLEYAPPEQLSDAKGVDHRADIYSLGATLYRMVVGHRPFGGRSPLDIARAIMNDPVPWSDEDLALAGPELRAILDKTMAKRPEDRYGSCRELVEALKALGK